jgi:hypothetical protein
MPSQSPDILSQLAWSYRFLTSNHSDIEEGKYVIANLPERKPAVVKELDYIDSGNRCFKPLCGHSCIAI